MMVPPVLEPMYEIESEKVSGDDESDEGGKSGTFVSLPRSDNDTVCANTIRDLDNLRSHTVNFLEVDEGLGADFVSELLFLLPGVDDDWSHAHGSASSPLASMED